MKVAGFRRYIKDFMRQFMTNRTSQQYAGINRPLTPANKPSEVVSHSLHFTQLFCI